MKTKPLSYLLYLTIAVLLLSFIDPYAIKRISDKEFKYEFYTSLKTVKAKSGRQYYWFKGGAIHHAQSGIVGEVLDGDFTKMYHGNQLAEQGQFSQGLKTGTWKTWYPDGTIQSEQYWQEGLRNGTWLSYDASGNLVEKGKYNKDRKSSKWINYQKKDTVVYKKGVVFIEKPKLTKEEKAALKIQKQKAGEAKKAAKASGKPSDTPKKKNVFQRVFGKKQASEKEEPKAGKSTKKDNGDKNFFQRLFSKKSDKQKPNG